MIEATRELVEALIRRLFGAAERVEAMEILERYAARQAQWLPGGLPT